MTTLKQVQAILQKRFPNVVFFEDGGNIYTNDPALFAKLARPYFRPKTKYHINLINKIKFPDTVLIIDCLETSAGNFVCFTID